MSLLTRLRTFITLGQGVVRGLPDARPGDDPIALFHDWFAAAQRAGLLLPEAMTLATATPEGVPAARLVLLKGVSAQGFTFFTNYESRKGQELAANPRAALAFHWPILQRQVRVEGPVERLSPEESNAYFQTRPRGARIGAWASRQSESLSSREELDRRVREADRRYPGEGVPRPPFWGGYRVIPERMEFWQGRVNRLHDRLLFERRGDGWEVARLYP